MKYNIYLAAPFFNPEQKANATLAAKILRSLGHTVYAPMEYKVPNAWDISNGDWAKDICFTDIEAIKKCDIVFMLNYGMTSDSGAAWEFGYAFALGKMIYNILMPQTETETSLMLFNTARKNAFWNDFLEFHKVIDVTDELVNQK